MSLELPPRTRRIHFLAVQLRVADGTTSAYAENTLALECFVKQKWNYLRVRGEYPK